MTNTRAEHLNKTCACQTLDSIQLRTQFERDPLLKGIYDEILQSRPNLFSTTSVYLSSKQLAEIEELITVIEETIKLPKFQTLAMGRSPAISHADHGPQGVFMGYDFHMSKTGPKLIEVNTNAGGALLNFELAKAQQQCQVSEECRNTDTEKKWNALYKKFYDMFMKEWKYQRPKQNLNLIAIVDDGPEEQFLYPEFQLFEKLLADFGTKAIIVDAKDLQFRNNQLCFNDKVIDMVYNRLTDFYLEESAHESIRQAYEAGAVVLTPSPHHHALFANKLNLVTLTDEKTLEEFSISPAAREILLKGIPKTEEVTAQESESLWERRKNLFFKPISGFGSKAAYRGDKITHKVWAQILTAQYVAQQIIPPSERVVKQLDSNIELKVDIRAYVYEGEILLLTSRLYSGQTTNFRTSGGGFAPVFIIDSL